MERNAARYYMKWSHVPFRSPRRYLLTCGIASIYFTVIYSIASQQYDVAVSWSFCLANAAMASLGCCLMTFIFRFGGVNASWIVARQAEQLMHSSDPKAAWRHLVNRYHDIHPLIINSSEFQKLLAEAVRRGGGPVAIAILGEGDGIGVPDDEAGHARKGHELERKGKLASKVLIVCMWMSFVILFIRLVWVLS